MNIRKRFLKKVFLFLFVVVLVVSTGAVVPMDASVDSAGVDSSTGRVFVLLGRYETGLTFAGRLGLSRAVVEEGGRYGFDPLFILALIRAESTFYNLSRSKRGAVGLMQVLPSTGKEVAKELNIPWEGEETLFNPGLNVKIGVRYFATLLRMYGGEFDKALAAYQSGPSYIDSMAAQGGVLPTGFSERVFLYYADLKERDKRV